MKITLTNFEIANIMGYLNSEESIVRNTTTKFSMEFCFAFRNGLRELKALYEDITQLHQEIDNEFSTEEFSEMNEDGQRVVKPEYVELYNKKISDLYNVKNELNIKKVKISHVTPGGIEGLLDVGISFPELDVLSWVIDDGELYDKEFDEKELESE